MNDYSINRLPACALIASCLLLQISCKSSSFSGGTTTKKEEPKPAIQPATPPKTSEAVPVTQTIPPLIECGPQGVTNAKLITPEIHSARNNEIIRFQMYLTDCNGKVTDVVANKIFFDIDIQTQGSSFSYDYKIFDSNNVELSSGELVSVKGSDLFGHTGDTYAHNQSNSTLNIQPGTKNIFLEIALGTLKYKPLEGDLTQMVKTYLGFDQASLVNPPMEILVYGEDLTTP